MSYRVWIDPAAAAEARATPGNVRQCIKQAMAALSDVPRPSDSKRLDWPLQDFEPRRIRIQQWRIIYAVDGLRVGCGCWRCADAPRYDYGDLSTLLGHIK